MPSPMLPMRPMTDPRYATPDDLAAELGVTRLTRLTQQKEP